MTTIDKWKLHPELPKKKKSTKKQIEAFLPTQLLIRELKKRGYIVILKSEKFKDNIDSEFNIKK